MSPLIIILVPVSLALGAGIWFSTVSLGRRDDRRKAVAVRMRMLAFETVTRAELAPAEKGADTFLKYLPDGFREWLEARIPVKDDGATISRVLLGSTSISFLITAVLGYFHIVALVLLPVIFLAAAGLIAWFYIRMAVAAKRAKFLELFPDGIDLIIRAVKAGLPITGALDAVGTEIPEPVGAEFRKLIADTRIGIPLDEALRRTARSVRTTEFDFFVASLTLQQESGGNIAETLQILSNVLRKRVELRAKTKAMTSEARASAVVLGALPVFLMVAISIMSPDFIAPLFTDQRGHYVLVGVISNLSIAFVVMRQMIRGVQG